MMREPSRQIAPRTPYLGGNLAAAAIQDAIMVSTSAESGELLSRADLPAQRTGSKVSEACPQIALLTPYLGGNLGDAAIQDAMIANLRLRLPGARFSGVSLNCENFVERHGTGAFPLCATDRPFYGMARGSVGDRACEGKVPARAPSRTGLAARIKRPLRRVPGLQKCLKTIRASVTAPAREWRHCLNAYRFLRTQDFLIVSGGGQLDDQWGGAWGHPFALFKWAVLARMARVPCAFASVGAGQLRSTASRRFISTALRLARYRSFRDPNSRALAAGLLSCAAADLTVPDLAFSLPTAELPLPAGLGRIAQGRPVIAITPIAFAKPRNWPHQDRGLYNRYLQEMGQVVSELLQREYFLVMVCSSLGDDESVIPELLERSDESAKHRYARQIHIPRISTWKDLVATFRDVDFLIASRLHSTILGFVTDTPTVAISFDPKVDWVMQDLGQADYLLHIRDFAAEDVIEDLDRLGLHKESVTKQIRSYQLGSHSAFKRQYDTLAELAIASHRRRN